MTTPSSRRPYFRPTTADQRRLLFEEYEATGKVTEACRRAHVGRRTFYYWWPRFDQGGYAALETTRSRAPHHPRRASLTADLRAEVLAYKQAHPTGGYLTIAQALRQAHGWEPVIGATSVRKILLAVPVSPPPAVSTPVPLRVVHAPLPGQTLNIDLGFVPRTHLAATPLEIIAEPEPAPSVDAANAPRAAAPDCPGQVFAGEQSYEEQMLAYVAHRDEKRARRHQPRKQRKPSLEEATLRSEEATLCTQRREQRSQRHQEDLAWETARQAHRAFLADWQRLASSERPAWRATYKAEDTRWQALRTARRATLRQRAVENKTWHATRQNLLQRTAQLPVPLGPLVAFLVVVDNMSRRCICLPVFTAGKNVTAEMVVAALQPYLPAGVGFIISDNGCQFVAAPFTDLAKATHFIHVRIAPRRPQTNGVAERFVQTTKDWLVAQTWNSVEELMALLLEFQTFYNDRPHQGEGMQGFSPNEFERRFPQCATC